MFYAVFSPKGLFLLLQFHFQRQMLEVFTSVPFKVKIHIISCCRREITVFSHIPVPDWKEISYILQKRSLLYVGDSIKYLGGLQPVKLASLLLIDGFLGRYRTQLKERESTLFYWAVFIGDDTAQSCFFSSPFLELNKMFN